MKGIQCKRLVDNVSLYFIPKAEAPILYKEELPNLYIQSEETLFVTLMLYIGFQSFVAVISVRLYFMCFE